MVDFTMPSLGADMEEGTLVEWLVAPGQAIRRGELIAVVETRKGAIEVECFASGTVAELVVAEGEKVPVGTVLARIATGDGEVTAPEPLPAPEPEPEPEPDDRASTPEPESQTRVRAAPAARRRAHELGVDLATVTGTGPRGAVQSDDVERAARQQQPAPTPTSAPATTPTPGPSPMRQAIAAAMTRANREIPHYHLEQTVDLAAATSWLATANADRPAASRLLPAALLIKATALALARHPALNGTWVDGDFVPGAGVHPGIAISLRGGGLVNPALFDADQRSLDEVMSALSDLVERARSGRLRGRELTASTTTITNLGDRGAEVVHGVIQPPQVALIGFGRVVQRPWAVDGMLAVRPLVRATLAGDHRATDGHTGGLLLTRIDRLLQRPERL